MYSLWQTLTLSRFPLKQWQQSSFLHRGVGLLEPWRRSSGLLQWGNEIGLVLISLVFVLAPFVPNSLIGLLLGASLGLWLLLTLAEDRLEQATPIHAIVLLYWGIATIATAFSPVRSQAIEGWIKLSLYLGFFVVMARILRSPRLRSILITLYLLVSLWVSTYGLHQWFSGAEALATWVDPESPLAQTTRVYSYLGNPNLLAGYLVGSVVFSLAAVFTWQRWLPKALAIVMVVVNTGCLILTFSRGGWIGMVVSVLVFGILLAHWWSVRLPIHWRRWVIPLVLFTLTGIITVAVWKVDALRDRVQSIFQGRGDSSNNFRINVWLAVLQMIRDRPLLGIGPGNDAFNAIYPLYGQARFTALSAYSIFLEVTVEAGLLGLGCFLWLLIVTFTQGWLHLQHLREQRQVQGLWLMAAIAAILGMLAHGMVDTVWYRPQVATIWWLMIALIASYYPAISTVSQVDLTEDVA